MNGGEEHSFEQPRASWRRHVVLAVVICAGLGLSLVGFAVVRGTEQRQTQMVFDHEADGLTSVTELDLETCSQELAALGRFYDGSKLVDREEFLAFVGPVLARHAGIYAFEWLPRVAAAERSAHEQTAREDGIDGYRINQRQAQGALAPAASRQEYFPVAYAEPLENNRTVLGFDCGSV
ncbi:MAG: CHASE domain-containing protein, partial [Candidatus Eisenbacteria sp.]|nr:CHASE domain-containing protein [Candidatus Eisenbacteria bacterium]